MSERKLKNEPGDWVVLSLPGAMEKPGKVVAADRERVTVEFKWRNGDVTERVFDHPLPRIRWVRQRGRSRYVRL